MNWKQLLWIIPLCLIIAGLIGMKIGLSAIDKLDNILTEGCEMAIDTMNYIMTENEECHILAIGYASKYKENITKSFYE